MRFSRSEVRIRAEASTLSCRRVIELVAGPLELISSRRRVAPSLPDHPALSSCKPFLSLPAALGSERSLLIDSVKELQGLPFSLVRQHLGSAWLAALGSILCLSRARGSSSQASPRRCFTLHSGPQSLFSSTSLRFPELAPP